MTERAEHYISFFLRFLAGSQVEELEHTRRRGADRVAVEVFQMRVSYIVLSKLVWPKLFPPCPF